MKKLQGSRGSIACARHKHRHKHGVDGRATVRLCYFTSRVAPCQPGAGLRVHDVRSGRMGTGEQMGRGSQHPDHPLLTASCCTSHHPHPHLDWGLLYSCPPGTRRNSHHSTGWRGLRSAAVGSARSDQRLRWGQGRQAWGVSSGKPLPADAHHTRAKPATRPHVCCHLAGPP